MANCLKLLMFMSLAVIILQLCILGFSISNRWNELVGSILSISLSLINLTALWCFNCKGRGKKWFLAVFLLLLIGDLIFQTTNTILLIWFQWVVIQYCIHLNVSIDISEYEGVACNDWWHFGKFSFKNWQSRRIQKLTLSFYRQVTGKSITGTGLWLLQFYWLLLLSLGLHKFVSQWLIWGKSQPLISTTQAIVKTLSTWATSDDIK